MNNGKRKLTALLILLVIFSLSMFALTSCGEDPDPGVQDPGLDNVYFMKDGENEYLFTITGNSFLISGLKGEQRGTFTYADGALTLSFAAGDDTVASATLEGNVLRLLYNGNAYRLVKRERFTVSFDVNGGSTVSSVRVLSGDTLAKPADPVKAGYAFIGWYTDNTYNEAFLFDATPITGDTTIYARFEEQPAGKAEYTVSFVCGDSFFTPLRTVNGVVYNLPTPVVGGKTFAGWWMSDSESSSKLTARYTGQKLTADTVLYAVFADGNPLVSVSGSGVTWEALGANLTYHVFIKKGDTVLKEGNVGATDFAFDFSTQPAGEYSVTVSVGEKSTTVYYRNKALGRASNFRVISGVLVFDPVEGAESYTITVLCGNPNHTHTNIYNGNSTNFAFIYCDMPAEGIRFAVTAKADGYLSSTATYTYYRALDTVEGIAIVGDRITWHPVENATGYLISVSKDGNEYVTATVTGGNFYRIADLGMGDVYVKVTPVSAGYYAAPAAAVRLTKTTLATPGGIAVSGGALIWDAVDGATSYVVTVNGKIYTADTNNLLLSDTILVPGTMVYTVSVQAIAADAANNSAASANVSLNYAAMGSVSYADHVVSWAPVYGAVKYRVRIGNRMQEVDGNKTSLRIAFAEAGTMTISVSFVDVNGDESTASTVDVEVFLIELDVRGGAPVTNIYCAFGDTLTLPETSRDGYDFAGWFTSPAGLTSGKEFTDKTFTGNADTILFAGWNSKQYNVTLDPGENGTVASGTVKVTYGKYNTILTATNKDVTMLFVGWYSEPDGAGIQYFNAKGEALVRWNSATDGITLYAHYVGVLKYTLINNGTEYAVSQGDYGIGGLSEITIPATFDGKPVTTVEASAFVRCTTLRTIHIPNTIQNIEIGTSGINSTGSAFQGCSNLDTIDIYEVPGAADVKYHTKDGVLYYKNPITGGMELKGCPYLRTGVLYIEEGTTVIPSGALSNVRFTEIYIPYTVKQIDNNAIYYCNNLNKIVFLPAPEGVDEVALTLDERSIAGCRQMTELTIPARLSNFNPNALYNCTGLVSIDVVGEGGNYSAVGENGKKVLCSADGKTLVFCPRGKSGEYTIPAGVEIIGESAFADCYYLTKVTIPGYVTTIGNSAFRNNSTYTYNSMLAQVVFEEDGQSLTIGEYAFYACHELTSVTLPRRLVKLGANAFGSISSLATVTINAAGARDADGNYAVDFANGAFGSSVANVKIGPDVPVFDVAGVIGQNIQSVTVDVRNANFLSEGGVLYNKAQTKILYYPASRVGDFTVPDSVVEIGDRVFQNRTALTGISIGPKVASIGENAFAGCTKLASVTFRSGEGDAVALVIHANAFARCYALTGIDLPSRLTTIGSGAFVNCEALASLTLPEGVVSIGSTAFGNCKALTKVHLPASLSDLSSDIASVFTRCENLSELTVAENSHYFAASGNILYKKTAKTTDDGTVYVADKLVFCPAKKGGSTTVTVPGTVTEIAPGAFAYNQVITAIVFEDLAEGGNLTIGTNAFTGCTMLTMITLPTGLKTIVKNMFYNCASLETIVIPYTVEKIENSAFSYCSSLSNLTFAPTPEGVDPVNLVIADASSYFYSPFNACRSLRDIVLPERLTVIGNNAFAGSDGFTSHVYTISLPSTLKRIGNNAFAYAMKLRSITFAPGTKLEDSGKLLGIGTYAFRKCTALRSITLPTDDTVSYSIAANAFYAAGLRSVSIPKAVKALGNSAFAYTDALETVTFETGATPTIGTNVFSDSALRSITLPANLTVIEKSLFQSCKNLTSITIPASVTSIGSRAFWGCSALTSVTFETYDADGVAYSRVAKIDYEAFTRTALTSFVFPTLEGGAALSLGYSLFGSCKSLTTVALSKSVTDVESVFEDCYSIRNFVVASDHPKYATTEGLPILCSKEGSTYLYVLGFLPEEYTVPSNITVIGDYAFAGQIQLKKLVIPETVKSIGEGAFSACTSLETVIFNHTTAKPSQLMEVGTYLFADCTSLTNVTLPDNMTEISGYMFRNCRSLSAITFPSAVTSIGSGAFQKTAFTSIVIPATVTSIGSYAFAGSEYDPGVLTSVTFAKDTEGKTALTSIGSSAFRYQALLSFTVPATVATLGTGLFENCKSLTTLTFEKGAKATSIPTKFALNCTALTSVEIPAAATLIDQCAFQNCTALRKIAIGEDSKMTQINAQAFDNAGITSIEIPASVTSLASSAFVNTKDLRSVTFAEGSKLTFIGTKCFQYSGIESIVIPSGVTLLGTSKTSASVGSSAYQFADCPNLRTVEFRGNLTKLGGYVFYRCTALETVTLPKTTTQIGNYCFKGCTSLKTIHLLSTADLTIGSYAFEEAGLTSVTIPGSTIAINAYAFRNCPDLAEVTYAAGAKNLTIGNGVFTGSGLVKAEIPARASKLGNSVYENCTKLKEIVFEPTDTGLTLGTSVFAGCVALTSVALPDRIALVPENAFAGDTYLTSLDLGKVSSIGAGAFRGTSLPEVTIPATCKSIGTGAFGDCAFLTTFAVEAGNANFGLHELTAGVYALVSKGEETKLVALPAGVSGVIRLPDGYQLNGGAIMGLTGVTGVILPDGITEIPDGAFAGAPIRTLILPDSVTTIGPNAFAGSALTSLTIPAGVTSIGNNAFADCPNLETVIFADGSKLESLGTSVFAGSHLVRVTFPAGITELPESTFANCPALEEVKFLGALTTIYRKAFQGSGLKEFHIPATVTILKDYVFENSAIETIEIPASLKELFIPDSAGQVKYSYNFRNCQSLKTVILNEGLDFISHKTFTGCTSLETILIPASVTEIGEEAFMDCTSLKNVIFAAGSRLDTIGKAAFKNAGVVSITLPDGLRSIGSEAFMGCADLTSITVPASVDKLPSSFLAGCTSLRSFTIPASVTSIDAQAFAGSGLTSITLPGSVHTIYGNTFKGCLSLESVVFEEGYTYIASSMFNGCINLKTVKLASTITSILGSAFEGCTSIEVIEIPKNVVLFDSTVFVGWTSAQTIRYLGSERDFSACGRDGCQAKIVWDYEPDTTN